MMMAFDVEEGEITGESEPESEIYHEGGGTHKSYKANAHSTSPNTPLSNQRSGNSLNRSTNKIMETFTTNINSPPTLPLVISPTKNEQNAFQHINEEEDSLSINPDKKWRKRSRWSDDMTTGKETSHQNRRSKDKCDREPVSYEDQSSNDTYKRKLDEYSPPPPHHSTTPPSKSVQLYPNKRGGKFHGGGPPKYLDLDQVPDGEDIDWPIGGKKADDTSRSAASVVKKPKMAKDYGHDNTYEHRKKGNNNIFEEDFDKQLRLAQKQAFGLPEEEDDVREEDDLDDDGRSSKTNSRDVENPFPCAHPYVPRDQQQNSTFKEGGGGPKRQAAGRREGRFSQNNFRSKPFNNNRGRDRFHRGGQASRAQSQSSTKYRGANNRSENRRGGGRGGQRRPHRDTPGGNYGGSGHRSEDRRNNSNTKFGNKNNGSRDKIVSNPPKMVCKFYAEGRCSKGQECNFSHDTKLNYKQEVCKYYVQNTCTKGDNCVFMHSEFPCKYFHSGSQCYAGDNCKFSHDVLSNDNAELLQKALNSPNHNQHQSYSNEDPLKLSNSPHNNRSHDTSDLFGDEDYEADTTNTHDKDAHHNNSKENQSFKHNFYSDPTAVGSGCDLNSSRDNESSLFGEGSDAERDPLTSPPSKHRTLVKVEPLDNNEIQQSAQKITPPKASFENIVAGKDAVIKVENYGETEGNPVVGPSEDNDEQSGDESDDEEDYKPVPLANFLSQLRGPTQQQRTPTNSNLNRGSSPVKPLNNNARVLRTSSPLKGNREGGRLNSSYMSLEEEEDDQDESSAKLKIVLEPVENETKPKKENSQNSHNEIKKEGSGSDGEEEEEDDRATYMGMGSVLGMLTAPASNNNNEQHGDEEEEEDDRATYMGLGSVLGMLTAPASNINNEQRSKAETSKEETYDKEYSRSEGGNWHHKDSRYDRRGDEDWGEGGNYDGKNHDRRRGGGGGGGRGNNKYSSYNNNQGQSDSYHQQPRRGRGGPRGRGRGFNRKNNDGDGGTNRGRWQGNKRFQQTHHHSGTDSNYQEEYYKANGVEGDYNNNNYNGGNNTRGRGGGMGRGGQGFNPRGGVAMAPNTYMGVMNNQIPPPHNPMYQTPAMLPIPFNANPYNPNFMLNTFGMNPYQQQPQPQHVPSLLEPSLADQYPKPPQREVSPHDQHLPAVVHPQPLARKGDPRSYHPHKEIKCNTPVPVVKAWILRAITGLCQKRRYQRPPNEILELDGKLIDPRTRHPNYKDALNKNPSNPDRASRNTHLDHAKDALHVVAPKSQGGEGSDPRIRRDPRLSRNSLTPLQNNIEHREEPHETEYLLYPDSHINKSPPNYSSPNHHNLNNHHRKGSAVNNALERGNNTPDHSSAVPSPSPKLEIAKEIVIQPFSQLLGVASLKNEVGENKLTATSLIPLPAGGITLLQNLPLSAKTLPSISAFKIPKKHKPAAPILAAKGNGEKAVSHLASSGNNDVDLTGSSSKTKLNISQYRARLGSLSTVLTAVKGNDDNATVNNAQVPESSTQIHSSSPSKNLVDRNLKESVFGILDESNQPAPRTEERVDEDDDVIFEKSVDSHKDSTIGGSSNIFATGSVLNNLKAENVFKNGDNIFNMYQEEVEDGAGGGNEPTNQNIADVGLGDDGNK